MYKIAHEIGSWFMFGIIMFVCGMVGQALEIKVPGSLALLVGFFSCAIGAFICAACTRIYDKGWNAAKIEQEPEE